MKKASEYINDLYTSELYNQKMVKDRLIRLIKQVQYDAIKETLIECGQIGIESDSVLLTLKQKLFKQLE